MPFGQETMTTEAEDACTIAAGDSSRAATEWLSESEAALLLGMSPSFVRRQISAGALKADRRDKTCLVARVDLANYIAASRVQPRALRSPVPSRPEPEPTHEQQGTPSPGRTRRWRRRVVLTTAGLVTAGIVSFIFAVDNSQGAQASVNGRAVAISSSGATVGGVLRAAHVRLPAGRLYSLVSHRVIRTDDRGTPAMFLLDGRTASLSTRVRAGDRVRVLPGSATEAAVVRDQPTSALLAGNRGVRATAAASPGQGLPAVERTLWRPDSPGERHVVMGAVSSEVENQSVPLPATPAVPETGKVVALSFDDGPDPQWTPQVLSILNQEGIKATFCLIARQVPANADLVRQEVAHGETLCDHTVDHDQHLDRAPRARVIDQVDRGADIIASVAGVQPGFYRPPGGTLSPTVIDVAHTRGLRVLYWSVDPSDYLVPPPAVLMSRILSQVGPGAVILLHDGGGFRANTVGILAPLIDTLKAQGYSFTTPALEPPAARP